MPYGYFTQQGYVGRVKDNMILFASERDYLDYIEPANDQPSETKTPTV